MQDVKTSSRFFGLAVLLGFFSILQMFFVEIGWKRVPAKGIPNGKRFWMSVPTKCWECANSDVLDVLFHPFGTWKSVVRKCQVERNVEPKRVELSTMFNWHVTFMSPKQCFQKTKKPSKHGKKSWNLFFFKKKITFFHYFFHYSVGMFLGIFISRSGHSLKGRKPAPGDPKPVVINVEAWKFDGKIHRW